MKFGGFIKNSFVDYPNEITAVVFTICCNFDCWYCHNKELYKDISKLNVIDESEVLKFLKSRKGMLDGLVVSGGEPTIHPEIKDFIIKVKKLDYKVKLDTNGTNPKLLKDLIDNKLVDFVAMDIKTDLPKYLSTVGREVKVEDLKQSIKIIMNSKIDYEFRTTFTPDINFKDFENAVKEIAGATSFAIQKYNPQAEDTKHLTPHTLADFNKALEIAKKYIPHSFLRSVE